MKMKGLCNHVAKIWFQKFYGGTWICSLCGGLKSPREQQGREQLFIES